MPIIQSAFSEKSLFQHVMLLRLIEIVFASLAMIVAGTVSISYFSLDWIEITIGLAAVVSSILIHRYCVIDKSSDYKKMSVEKLVAEGNMILTVLIPRLASAFCFAFVLFTIPKILFVIALFYIVWGGAYMIFWVRMYNPDPLSDYYPPQSS